MGEMRGRIEVCGVLTGGFEKGDFESFELRVLELRSFLLLLYPQPAKQILRFAKDDKQGKILFELHL